MTAYVVKEFSTGHCVGEGVLVSGPLPSIGHHLLTWKQSDDGWDRWRVLDVEHHLHNTGPDVLAARIVVVVEAAR